MTYRVTFYTGAATVQADDAAEAVLRARVRTGATSEPLFVEEQS